MLKCISDTYNSATKCFKRVFGLSPNYDFSQNDEMSSLKYTKLKVLQLSSSDEFVLQGDYKNMENYDIFYSFLCKPLVKIYIEEIFKPNKEIKKFQASKVRGIYDQIKYDINALFERLGLELFIPLDKYNLSTPSFDLESNPATDLDLDLYTPLFMMEFWIYPKSFIRKVNLQRVTFVHDIKFTTNNYTQERTGCPEYNQTHSIILAIQERNLAYIRIVLHHEFFHYIDYADDKSFDDEGWENLNQKGFEYGNGGDSEREWIKLEKGVNGFINHYSTTALEEDRAEIYQYLIGCPDEAVNNKDEIVSKKAKRIQDFVNNLDKDGIGDIRKNFWANLIDFRNKYVYKEHVFQGNVFH